MRDKKPGQGISTELSNVQPAVVDDGSLLLGWKPAYKRGFGMPAPLAVIRFLLGVLCGLRVRDIQVGQGVKQFLLKDAARRQSDVSSGVSRASLKETN
jgi:hypothetical protein